MEIEFSENLQKMMNEEKCKECLNEMLLDSLDISFEDLENLGNSYDFTEIRDQYGNIEGWEVIEK